MTERDRFGPSLRLERERRGISLEDIARQTKISVSFLAALERSDLSRWPGGIFRRSFVRSYAQVVGLDPDRTVREFLRLFPGDEEIGAPRTDRSVATPEAVQPRALHLVKGNPRPAKSRAGSLRRKLGMAGIELALVGGVGAALGMTLDWSYAWPAVGLGVVAVVAANLRLNRTPPRPPAVETAPVVPGSAHARHVTERRAEERHETSRRHRPRRPGQRRRRGAQ